MGREAILNAVKKNKPSLIPLTEMDATIFKEPMDLLQTFMKHVPLVGAQASRVESVSDMDRMIKKQYPEASKVVSLVKESTLGSIEISEETDPHALEAIDLVIIPAQLGVAENAAVWIDESLMKVRALPFIAKHLVVVLNKNTLCANMHDAYSLLGNRRHTFGTFISGPSKTADIEQSLVIGAHGALSVTVFIL